MKIWAPTGGDFPGQNEPIFGWEQPNISFGNILRGIDFDLGGRAGAIGLRYTGSQGSYLLLIVGDGIREGVGAIAQFLDRNEALAVRGSIRLQRQLTTLANRTDVVACSFDEQTPDHRWNRLIKAGLRVVRRWIRGLKLNRQWVELSAAFEEVSDVTHPRALLANIHYDRQAVRYRPAITW